ncbi:MAG: aldehyde dehydrogenase family protein, partial [Terriglobales bacterium]
VPAGVFAILFDDGITLGQALVQHPAVKAVGFTGSLKGGRALMDLAGTRPEPIPVYAEMGSGNPVFLLPEALAQSQAAIAKDLAGSVTLGAGQFCTKPGVVFVHADQAKPFARDLAAALAATGPFTLLTAAIDRSFRAGAEARARAGAVEVKTPAASAALLLQTDAAALELNPALADELFGPATLLVVHASGDDLLRAAERLHGHLTATVHGTENDLRQHSPLLHVLERKVGRIVFNGYPTGVEVTDAMMHGGPYPASSSRETSVGTAAILRFTRRVCYQNAPEAVLPPELRNDNPLKIRRRRNGTPE